MSRLSLTPTQIADAVAMREVGYSVLSISQRLCCSPRTIHRVFEKFGTKKGVVREDVVDAARAAMLHRVTSDPAIREEAARLVHDDLAHSRHLREVLTAASEKMEATDLREAVLVMRAAAAYSTALKNTSDMLRRSLRLDRIGEQDEQLPVLVIRQIDLQALEKARSASAADQATLLTPEHDEAV